MSQKQPKIRVIANRRPSRGRKPKNLPRQARLRNRRVNRRPLSRRMSTMKSTVGTVPLSFSTSISNTKAGYTYAVGRGGRSIIISGMDYLVPIVLPANAQAGQILVNSQLNPIGLSQSRLSSFALLFDRYIPHTFTIEYEPSCPAFTSGTLLMYIDHDAENNPGNVGTNPGINVIKRGTTQLNSITSTCYSKASTSYRYTDDNKTHTNFYCQPGENTNDSYFGRALVMVSASAGNLENLAVGTLYMKYRFEFFVDQLAIPATSIGSLTNWLSPISAIAAAPVDLIARLDTPVTTSASLPQILPPIPASGPLKVVNLAPLPNGSLFQLTSTIPKVIGSVLNFAGYLSSGLQPLLTYGSDNLNSTMSVFRIIYRIIDNSNAFIGHSITPSISQSVSPALTLESVPIVEEIDDLIRSKARTCDFEVIYDHDGHYHTVPIESKSPELPRRKK